MENGKLNVVDAEIIVSHATPEQKKEIISMIEYKNALGLKYRISTIKPKKRQSKELAEDRVDEPEFQIPAIIVLQKLDVDDDNTQLIKEKIKELNTLLASSSKGKCVEIWYKPDLDKKDAFEKEIETLHKRWEPTRFQNGEQIWPK